MKEILAEYKKQGFMEIQLRQIQLGLEERLPVEVYAKPEYDWFQMEEIRKGLKTKVDVEVYAKPEIPYEKMRQLRKGLQAGMNLSRYLDWDAGVIRELRHARCAGVNILRYITEGYDAEQLCEIRMALENGIDIAPYLCKEYRAASIAQIRKGLERGVDVSHYAKIYYSWRQMREIRKGLENRVEVSLYNGHLYSWDQMREIRLGLQEGLDVSSYRMLRYTAGVMREKRLALLGENLPEEEDIFKDLSSSQDFKIELRTNNMEAYLTVQNNRGNITHKEIMTLLERNNIRFGILEDNIDKIVNGKHFNTAVLVAKGQIPTKGADGWYEYFFRTNVEKKPRVLADGTVDYHNIEWFEVVREGQKLVYYHPAEDGKDGFDVTGQVIPARKGAEKRILTGKGFKLEEDKRTYTAVINGMIRLEDNEMSILNHLMLDEINTVTGNIVFDGSIHITGDVGNGMSVKATGDVVVDGNVEAATIESGGSIMLKKGMNSAGNGLIQAKKNVVSRFFESTKVIAGGNIEVDKCLNSQLYAGGMITSTRAIAGGVARAELGFRVNHVGNHAGIHTVLKIQVDEQVREEYKNIVVGIKEVGKELQMLNSSYEEYKEKFTPEERSEMAIFQKLEKAVFTKGKQLMQLKTLEAELKQVVERTRTARVVISGQAHEGTLVELNGSRWEAEDQQNITIKQQHNQVEVVTN